VENCLNILKKVEISKSGSISLSCIIRTHYNTKIGVMGPTSAEKSLTGLNFFSIFGHFPLL
jgi:hypothetical protein